MVSMSPVIAVEKDFMFLSIGLKRQNIVLENVLQKLFFLLQKFKRKSLILMEKTIQTGKEEKQKEKMVIFLSLLKGKGFLNIVMLWKNTLTGNLKLTK